MRPAARLLLAEAAEMPAILDRTPPEAFDLPTICAGWSVRDVLAHCSAALTAVTSGGLHRFTPADNQRDVDLRREWPLGRVKEELLTSYQSAAAAIDAADGRFDAIGLGEWVHGGDVREAIGEPGAYASAGIDLALPLLVERSASMGKPQVLVELPTGSFVFGVGGDAGIAATLNTDVETFVRLCGGRAPDPQRYDLAGAGPVDLLLFS